MNYKPKFNRLLVYYAKNNRQTINNGFCSFKTYLLTNTIKRFLFLDEKMDNSYKK